MAIPKVSSRDRIYLYVLMTSRTTVEECDGKSISLCAQYDSGQVCTSANIAREKLPLGVNKGNITAFLSVNGSKANSQGGVKLPTGGKW